MEKKIVNKAEKNTADLEKEKKVIYFSNSLQEQIFNMTNNGICLIGTDFDIIQVNEAYCTISGLKKEEIIGKNCFDVIHCLLCHSYNCPLTQILNGNEFHEQLIEIERIDDMILACVISAAPFRGLDDKLSGIIESITDITEYNQTERVVRKSKEELEKKSKQLDILNAELKQLESYSRSDIKSINNITSELSEDYENTFDLFMKSRNFKIQERISEKTFALSYRFGMLNIGPRDIIKLHLDFVRKKMKRLSLQQKKHVIDEARFFLIEIMGNVINFYRNNILNKKGDDKK